MSRLSGVGSGSNIGKSFLASGEVHKVKSLQQFQDCFPDWELLPPELKARILIEESLKPAKTCHTKDFVPTVRQYLKQLREFRLVSKSLKEIIDGEFPDVGKVCIRVAKILLSKSDDDLVAYFDAIYNTQKFGDVTVTQKQILIACLECDCPKTIGALLIISNDDYPNREGRFLDSDFYRDNRENSPVQFALSFLNSESAMLFLRECLENTKNSLLRIAFTHALMRASDVELKQFLEMRSTDAINNEFITVVKGALAYSKGKVYKYINLEKNELPYFIEGKVLVARTINGRVFRKDIQILNDKMGTESVKYWVQCFHRIRDYPLCDAVNLL